MGNSVESYEDRNAGLSPDHIRDYVEKVTKAQWSGAALDVGTGSGGWVKWLVESEKFSKIFCTDLIDCRGEEAKSLEFFKADLTNEELGLSENSLDYVFAIEVIEHIENPRRFLREIYRVLKPGGRFVMSTPSCDSFRARLSLFLRGYFPAFCRGDYEGSGHITPVTMLDFERMITEAGFSSHANDFGMPGQMPAVKVNWQGILPFLKGNLWSDNFISVVTK